MSSSSVADEMNSRRLVLEWTNNFSRLLQREIREDAIKARNVEHTAATLLQEMLSIGDGVRFIATDRPCRTTAPPFDINRQAGVPPGEYNILLRLICAEDGFSSLTTWDIVTQPVQPLPSLPPLMNRRFFREVHKVTTSIDDLPLENTLLSLLSTRSYNRWQLVLFLVPAAEQNNNNNTQFTDFAQHAKQYPVLYDSNCVRTFVQHVNRDRAIELWGETIAESIEGVDSLYVVTFEFLPHSSWINVERHLNEAYMASLFAKSALQLPAALTHNRPQIPNQERVRQRGVPPMPHSSPESSNSLSHMHDGNLVAASSQRTMHNDLRLPELDQMSLQRADNILVRMGANAPPGSAIAQVLQNPDTRGLITQPQFYSTNRDSMYERLSLQDWRTWNGIATYRSSMSHTQSSQYNPTATLYYDFSDEMRQLWSRFWTTLLRCVKREFPVQNHCIKIIPVSAWQVNPELSSVHDIASLHEQMFDETTMQMIPIASEINISTDEAANAAEHVSDLIMVAMVQERNEKDFIIVQVDLERELIPGQDLEQFKQLMIREFPTLMRADKMGISLLFHEQVQSGRLIFVFVKAAFYKEMTTFHEERLLRWIHANIDPRQFNWQFKPLPAAQS